MQGDVQQLISLQDVVNILQPRAHELLTLAYNELEKDMLRQYLNAGFVITGGGSLLSGLPELASTILKVPVRIGKPRSIGIMLESLEHPMYATGYGLLLHALKKRDTATIPMLSGNTLSRIVTRMKSWVSEFF
jgi:cell division protein FtsA